MNRAGFIGIAASTAALLCLSARADLDKLDGTRSQGNPPPVGVFQGDAQASADPASTDAKNIDAAEEKTKHK